MENIINNYYNLFPDDIKKRYGGFLFQVDDAIFILTELTSKPEAVLDLYNTLLKYQIGNFIIVNNKIGETFSKVNDKNYILYKIRCDADAILSFNETINIPGKSSYIWSKIWSERIDYYEIQVNELGQEKSVILNSIYYYIGLAENAITMAGKIEKTLEESDYAIQHYRMNVPVYKAEYFNPNNMLIDVAVRDLAEYIKSSFFNNSKEPDDYLDYLLSLVMDAKKANMLFARLLYPTYYFDIFDEVILNEREEDDLVSVIRNAHKYESFLVRLYEKLSLKHQMLHIGWLKKGAKAPH